MGGVLEMIKPGKYEELSNTDYHADTNSISRSAIMDFMSSPRKYWANYLNPNRPEKKTTPAMAFGEQFHCMILEPKKFIQDYCLEPITLELPKVGLLKELGREEYDRQKAQRVGIEDMNNKIMTDWTYQNRNRKTISNENHLQLKEMATSIMQNERAWNLIKDAKYEQSYFWEDSDTGILLKARPDILHEHFIVDLKTARDASPKGFQRSMCEGGYHIQAAMIIDAVKAVEGRDVQTFINIVVEKEYPFSVGVYVIDQAAVEFGRIQYKRALSNLKDAREANSFLDYETQVIGLPNWYEGGL